MPRARLLVASAMAVAWALLAMAAHGQEPPVTADEPLPPIHGPRDLLLLYGVDQSQWNRVEDRRPVHPDERELLLRLLYLTDRFQPADRDRWAYREHALDAIAREADRSRGELFALQGRIVEFKVREPVPELIERFEFDRYYECRFAAEGGGEALVVARTVPQAWMGRKTIDERGGFLGIFVKLAGTKPDASEPVFVTDRVAWYPDTLLGRLGMDVGLLDTLRDDRGLTADEADCFYQMLAAVGRARPGELTRAARAQAKRAPGARAETRTGYSIVPLFNAPDTQRGRLVELTGRARSVLRINLDQGDEAGGLRRYGFDHYYQVSLFTEDSQGNPLTVCVREIPKGMPLGEGPQYGEQIVVSGFFLKRWSYRIASDPDSPTVDDDRLRKQLAPLLVGRELQWVPNQPVERNGWAGLIAVGILFLGSLGIALALWRGNRRQGKGTRFRISSGDDA